MKRNNYKQYSISLETKSLHVLHVVGTYYERMHFSQTRISAISCNVLHISLCTKSKKNTMLPTKHLMATKKKKKYKQ